MALRDDFLTSCSYCSRRLSSQSMTSKITRSIRSFNLFAAALARPTALLSIAPRLGVAADTTFHTSVLCSFPVLIFLIPCTMFFFLFCACCPHIITPGAKNRVTCAYLHTLLRTLPKFLLDIPAPRLGQGGALGDRALPKLWPGGGYSVPLFAARSRHEKPYPPISKIKYRLAFER